MNNNPTFNIARSILQYGVRYLPLSLAVILTMVAIAFAQSDPEFGIAPLSAPEGIELVIGGPILHPSSAADNGGWIGYHVYRRRAGDTAFVRITSVPLARPGSLAALETAMGGALDGFERFSGLASKQELWQSIERNDSSIVMMSFLSKNFRRALGLLLLDTQVERNITYEYRATRVAQDGSESAPCESQQATYGVPLIPMLGPLSVKGESTESGVALSWTANPADSGAFSYSIYRSPDSTGSLLRLNLAALTLNVDSAGGATTGTFIDTTARPGRTYYYAVVSTDYVGNESPRSPLVPVNLVDRSRPLIPQNLFANPTDLGITLTWDTVPGAVAGYNVYRSLDADSGFTRLNTVLLPADTGYFEDKSTSLVDRYFYRVTAVNASGRESERSALALSLYENRLPPISPQNVSAEPQENGVLVRWQSNEEADLRGYYVFRADGFNGVLSQVSPFIGKDTTLYLDTARYLSSAGQYWYLVQAINYTGLASSFSVPAVAHTDKPEPADAPRAFFGYPDGTTVRLFWGSPGDNATSGYHVYRSRETDSTVWTRLTPLPLPRTTGGFTDSSAAMGSAYRYQIRAITEQGVESTPSHDLRIVMYEPAPLPPGGIRVAPDGAALTVLWSKTLQGSVSGYRVYRRTDTENSVLLTAQPLAVMTTVYRDDSVRSGVRYYYAVSCVDQYGREGDRSAEIPYVSE